MRSLQKGVLIDASYYCSGSLLARKPPSFGCGAGLANLLLVHSPLTMLLFLKAGGRDFGPAKPPASLKAMRAAATRLCLLDQHRPVIPDPERPDRMVAKLRPGAEVQIVRSVQPCVPLLGVQDHRHPGMQVGGRVIGGAGKDGAGQQVVPAGRQTGENRVSSLPAG